MIHMSTHMRSNGYAKVRKFLSQWQGFDHRVDVAIQTRAADLFKEWSRLDNRIRGDYRKTAPLWNIFDVLRVSHLETKLHTPFLQELFNSQGRHGQGTLFFRQLLREIARQKGGIREGAINSYARFPFDNEYDSRQEVFDPISGRMDLVIERRQGRNKFCIIIENKIQAVEQRHQMARYEEYLKRHPAKKNRRFLNIAS